MIPGLNTSNITCSRLAKPTKNSSRIMKITLQSLSDVKLVFKNSKILPKGTIATRDLTKSRLAEKSLLMKMNQQHDQHIQVNLAQV